MAAADAAVDNALIIGGGFSGMSAAVELRKRGVAVDLVEIDPDWRSYGAGITMCGAGMRALVTLGVIDEFMARGGGTDGLRIETADGHPVAEVPSSRMAGPDYWSTGGIMRPVLARILAGATRAAGTDVRLGCTFTRLDQDGDAADATPDGVTVSFDDGTSKRYDLVIGADGINSAVRAEVFPDAPRPAYTGQAVWRTVIRRPVSLTDSRMWMGHKVKAGVTPVSDDEMYLFVTEDRPPEKARVGEDELLPLLSAMLEPFTAAPMVEIRGQLGDSPIVYRPLEGLLTPRPWFRGRTVLIGDAAHATTPHLAAGAALGMEDAIVLADELAGADTVPAALEAFMERRWERCRLVVESSLRLGEIEIAGGDQAEHAQLMADAGRALAQPI
jgi:2-polyprenyl-6-methoxyphenol hydroxylase-like FAD-dependent oxidoreductase